MTPTRPLTRLRRVGAYTVSLKGDATDGFAVTVRVKGVGVTNVRRTFDRLTAVAVYSEAVSQCRRAVHPPKGVAA